VLLVLLLLLVLLVLLLLLLFLLLISSLSCCNPIKRKTQHCIRINLTSTHELVSIFAGLGGGEVWYGSG
jgi:hypothetical protein